MPATSVSGEPLARRSSSGRERLALEVEDHDVALGDQHLAQAVVAVEARLGQALAAAAVLAAISLRLAAAAPAPRRSRRSGPRRRRRSCSRAAKPRCGLGARCGQPARPDRPAVPARRAKAGSSVGVARARCSSAVRRPSRLGHGEVELVQLSRRRPAALRGCAAPPRAPGRGDRASTASRRPGWRRRRKRRPVPSAVPSGADVLDRAQERQACARTRPRRSGSGRSRAPGGCPAQPAVDLEQHPLADHDRRCCSARHRAAGPAPRARRRARRAGPSTGSAGRSRRRRIGCSARIRRSSVRAKSSA